MMEFQVSAKALEDLKSIGRYTQKKWGTNQRNKYLSMLDAGFHTIAHSPDTVTILNNLNSLLQDMRKQHQKPVTG